jgi:hypothetical protein
MVPVLVCPVLVQAIHQNSVQWHAVFELPFDKYGSSFKHTGGWAVRLVHCGGFG